MEFLSKESKGVHGILRVEAGWEVWGSGTGAKNVLIPSHPSSWGARLVLSRAGRAWRWSGIRTKFWPGQIFESDAMTCLIYIRLQMPCIIYQGTPIRIYNFSRKRVWFGCKTSELGPWSPWNLMLGMLSKISGFHGFSEVVKWCPPGQPLNGSARQLHITDLGHPETHPSHDSTDPMMWKIDKRWLKMINKKW